MTTRERDMLHHGTQLCSLKPQNLVQAAEADLRLRTRKLCGEAKPTEPYAFWRAHVRRARDVEHLIRLAATDRGHGLGSAKLHTRLIYEGEQLLRAALGLFGGGGQWKLALP